MQWGHSNTNLFGDNIMSRIKELGDPTKISLGIGRNTFGNRGKFGLNFKGPAFHFLKSCSTMKILLDCSSTIPRNYLG